MRYADGWAALNLQMPPRVPRTEYSAHEHWPLVAAVTGISVGPDSPGSLRWQASRAFIQSWNYDFWWSTLIHRQEFGNLCTDMGHAEYAAGGGDRRDTISCPFQEPEEVLAFDPMPPAEPIHFAAGDLPLRETGQTCHFCRAGIE